MIDSSHTFLFEVGGQDLTDYIDYKSILMQDAEGAEIDTLTFDVVDTGTTIDMDDWDEVQWTIDAGEAEEIVLFGGYVVSARSRYAPGGIGRVWMVRCESYTTRLHRCEMPHKGYVQQTPRQIISDLFTEAGLTDFDTVTYVTEGTAMDSFAVEQTEKLAAVLDRLVELQGWVWRIDGEKYLHCGAVSSDPAPFQVTDEANANYGSSSPAKYPATGGSVEGGRNAQEIINEVFVLGGKRISDTVEETFTGDALTSQFNLAHRDIYDVEIVTVDDEIYTDGTEWWHDFTERQVLTNYREGYIRFEAAPADDAEIVVKYTYWIDIVYSEQNTASIAAYGMTFTHYEVDRSITSQEQAEAVAAAILAEFAYGVMEGSLQVARLGIRAGQQLRVRFDTLDINGAYPVRSVSTALAPSLDTLVCDVRFGGRSTSLSDLVAGVRKSRTQAAYEPPSAPPGQYPSVPGELGIAHLSATEPGETFVGMVWVDIAH